MKSLKRSRIDAGLDNMRADEHLALDSDDDDSLALDDNSSHGSRPGTPQPKSGKKTRGRVKINMEFIDNKLRRYTTFSKRKSGIMKKAHELATLTGTQVMLLVASETGHVYTFATRKLQPILSSEAGKQLIQTCLNSPDPGDSSAAVNSAQDEQRMSAQGFEEPELSYIPEETKDAVLAQKTYHIMNSISSQQTEHSPTPPAQQQQSSLPVNLVAMSNSESVKGPTIHLPSAQGLALMQTHHGGTQLDHQHLLSSHSPSSMHMLPSHDPSTNIHHSPQHKYLYSTAKTSAEEAPITLFNSYAAFPRTNVQPLLVADTRSLQMQQTQVAIHNQQNHKKTTR
uniref:Serum response factor n=1 Tax=Phallusia mammillata TaxID=59560 RepID=A0A6F9DT08_9ASCI|nr:SRF serum response factor/blistered [Phallusia mammillata]